MHIQLTGYQDVIETLEVKNEAVTVEVTMTAVSTTPIK